MEENDRMPNGYGSLTNKVAFAFFSPNIFVLRVGRRLTVFFVVVGRRTDQYNTHTEPPTRLGHDTTRPRQRLRHAEVCYIRPALTKAYSTRELALSNPSLSLGPFPSSRLLTPRTVDRRVVVTGHSFRFISPRRKRISPT